MPELFLLGQQLSRLKDGLSPDDRKSQVCGCAFEEKAWLAVGRQDIVAQAIGATPSLRVGLVCDAGLGKTTNMEWLQAHLAERGSRQVPLLLQLHASRDLELLQEELSDPSSLPLLRSLAKKIFLAAGGDAGRHLAGLVRQQAAGEITLLIDGLDHVSGLSSVKTNLAAMLDSSQWQRCPVWIAGRPTAFEKCWSKLFSQPGWQFLRVHRLQEREIRFFLTRTAGGDCYEQLQGSHGLLAIPRFLRLISGILRGALAGIEDGAERAAVVDLLKLDTPAAVYTRAFFHLDEEDDPEPDKQGLLAQGLQGDAARIGLGKDYEPQWNNRKRRVERTASLLGAIAFQMLDRKAAGKSPTPAFSGVKLHPFQDQVARRMEASGQGTPAEFERDFGLLKDMDIHALDFLLFRESDDKRLAFHDRTVQAFFAAYWACHCAMKTELRATRRWVVDPLSFTNQDYHEFWQFAAELPDQILPKNDEGEVDPQRWLWLFRPLYDSSVVDAKNRHVRSTEFIFRAWKRIQKHSPRTIARWRAPAVVPEIESGLRQIPAGICHYGADTLADKRGEPRYVVAFRLHKWPVTNEMYELFDPGHLAIRWARKHPLAGDDGHGDDRCPVVSVTWYHAWCFAEWCGCRLPTELEWEHAARAGTATAWFFGNEKEELKKYAHCGQPVGGCTSPVDDAKRLPNAHELYDMPGNVWEWCLDPSEPRASARVARGGDWCSDGWQCRSSERIFVGPMSRSLNYGFRLAAVPVVVALLGGPPEETSGARATEPHGVERNHAATELPERT